MTWINYGSKAIKEIHFWNPWGSRLPSAYQEVEYIQSSWSQYINSWYTPKNTTKVDFKISWWSSWDWQIFWETKTRASGWQGFSIVFDAYNFNAIYNITHWLYDWWTHTWSLSQEWLYVDWVKKSTPSTTSFTWAWVMWIFCINYVWWSWFVEKTSNKLYYLNITEWWVKKREMIPCYRKSDNVIWLYDLVEWKFYTNAWTWTFTKWANVTQNYTPIKAVYYWSKKIWPIDLPSTVVCNFIASWWWTTSLDTIKSTSFSHWNASSIASWSNWTVRYSISKTDVHAWIALWWYANNLWNNNWWEINRSSNLKQKLIKKAYLKISNLFYSTSWYPVFTPAWVYVEFSKHVISTNFTDYNSSTSTKSMAWFIYPRWNNSSWSSYITYPVDSNTQYLALPTTPAWVWKTSTWYIDQWKSCLYSRVILEVKWSNASNFHYRLTVEETWNSYDLWLCSALWSCCIRVWSWDRWMVWAYKEVSEAYLEVYDNWYITETWAISQTKPR